jgi:tetratricopeptide (TPR) repeat protein
MLCSLGSLKEITLVGEFQIPAIARKTAINRSPAENSALLAAVDARQNRKLEKAEKHIKLALKRTPSDPNTLHQAALIARDRGRNTRAIQLIEKAAEFSPHSAAILCDMGLLYKSEGDNGKSIACQRRVCGMMPDSAPAWSNLGTALNAADQYDEAIRALSRAIDINPQEPEFHFNRANAYLGQGDLNPAITSYERTIELAPYHLKALINLAAAQKDIGRISQAEKTLATAALLAPTNPDVLWNEALLKLSQGDYQNGWAAYEARRSLPGFAIRHQDKPAWDGGDLEGRKLLIHAEQGFGDTLQFCRYLKHFVESDIDFTVELPERLLPLLSNLPTSTHHVAVGQNIRCDVQAPLMSLPHLIGPTTPFYPATGAYLAAEERAVVEWRERLPSDSNLRVAICWQGNPDYRADTNRSIPLDAFSPIAALPDIQLISLQQGEATRSLGHQSWGTNVRSLGNDIDTDGAFVDSAAILNSVDLLITSDTAMAHLGGALGVETWLALAFVPDWRWGLCGTDTNWYPSMKLYRQPQHGDWASVFERMTQDLKERCS